ncbi:aminotransferase class IV [Thalassorhabdomicrobium marinisediminis]|uniref:aminotransferase class IV n=1 Tax=Thalassorhabdomicrobium marinisediminis TaxID=2170577 RepID=UPI0024919F16|nr:aminotransferase class IV [Thalassorhabdomicrobium marinisediminis]
MSGTVWINGVFKPEAEAFVPIFDRGLLFSDAVYEGIGVLDGKLLNFPYHMARLRRSLDKLGFTVPITDDGFRDMFHGLIGRNSIVEGFVYLHVTRGVQPRDYLYPEGLIPTVFAFAQSQVFCRADDTPSPIRMASSPDLRWARRDIKTSNLLGQVLAKKDASRKGCEEVLMYDGQGYVTEGGAVSFFILKDGKLFARPLGTELLPGVTRKVMLQVAEANDVEIVEDRYRLEDVYGADEAFITGASRYVHPVGQIDDHLIGNGRAGPITLQLRRDYLVEARATLT